MASDSSRRRQDAPRPTPAGARPHPRSAAVALAVAFLAIAVVAVASFAAHLETATRGPEGVPTYVASQLGARRSSAAPAGGGIHAHVAGGGATARVAGHDISLASVSPGARAWRQYDHGAVRTTAFGHEAITTSPGAFQQFTTVERHQGVRTWRWNIASSTLEPRLRADGSVALLADGQPSGLVIPAVMILDAGGRSVKPGVVSS